MDLWLENIAKFEIAHYLENKLKKGNGKLRVLDIGAGTGGDWGKLLNEYSNLELHLWEPYIESEKILRKSLKYSKVIFHENLEVIEEKIEIILSLSVLEHVKDRDKHFKLVSKLLDKGGSYICNFDDGHFRYESKNIWKFSSNKIALSETYRTLLSKLFKKWYSVGKYQSKVDLEQIFKIAHKYGLRIDKVDFRNLGELKGLCKNIEKPLDKHKFAELWLEFEKKINSDYGLDTKKLEKLFGSRTIYFTKI